MRTRVLAPEPTRTTREEPAFGRVASLYAASASLAAGVLVGESLGLPLGESLLRAVGFAVAVGIATHIAVAPRRLAPSPVLLRRRR